MTERAGFVSRLVAFIIDASIVAIVVRTIHWILQGAEQTLRRFAPPIDLPALVLALLPLFAAAYLFGFWTALGQTPGKLLMGVKVVAVGGSPIGWRRALIRVCGYVLSAIPCYLGFFWILGPKRRGWHDKLARTEVVYVPARRRAATQVPRQLGPMTEASAGAGAGR
jgi:uncharacterized RDD family membrane protein YckC